LNVEIWPGSTHFFPGEGLRLLIQGTDVMVPNPVYEIWH